MTRFSYLPTYLLEDDILRLQEIVAALASDRGVSIAIDTDTANMLHEVDMFGVPFNTETEALLF